jgi:uncharacterized protein YukJ
MTPTYGYVKCKVVSEPVLKASHHGHETQYHLHANLRVATEGGGTEQWDTAINVGTNDADDLLNYKLVFDYHHPIITTLQAAAPGFHDLTDADALPALDFLRADVLAQTGHWRESDVMDGSDFPEPGASLKRLLHRARSTGADVYVFGRTYTPPDKGIHDVHMNQGSSGRFINSPGSTNNERNEPWQDGAVLVDLGQPEWAAYFTAFTQQNVPTDDLGNPASSSHGITDSDDGSLAGQ